MEGLSLLGVERVPRKPSVAQIFTRYLVAAGAGALASVYVPSHPVLAAINTAAAVSNTYAAIQGERTWGKAATRMGRHVVATAGALALPVAPVVGWLAGAIAGELIFDGKGGGLLEDFVAADRRGDVIDGELADDDNSKALVKR
jgi:hypothetical protein